MRHVLLSMMLSAVVALAVPARSSALPSHAAGIGSAPSVSLQADQPTKGVNVDINVNRTGGGGRWWRSPAFIGIAIVGGVLVLLLLVLVARGGGGGTTIVR
jgi:hypothetical protein